MDILCLVLDMVKPVTIVYLLKLPEYDHIFRRYFYLTDVVGLVTERRLTQFFNRIKEYKLFVECVEALGRWMVISNDFLKEYGFKRTKETKNDHLHKYQLFELYIKINTHSQTVNIVRYAKSKNIVRSPVLDNVTIKYNPVLYMYPESYLKFCIANILPGTMTTYIGSIDYLNMKWTYKQYIRMIRINTKDMKIVREEWKNNIDEYYATHINIADRNENLPALTIYDESTYGIAEMKWDQNGKLHRRGDQPAVINFYKGGKIDTEEWYYENKRHRENGPALITYRLDGRIARQVWYKFGKVHRENGPAVLVYTYEEPWITEEEYFLRVEEWCLENKCHREDGPAYTLYASADEFHHKEWYVRGTWQRKELSKKVEEFEKNGVRYDRPYNRLDDGGVFWMVWCDGYGVWRGRYNPHSRTYDRSSINRASRAYDSFKMDYI